MCERKYLKRRREAGRNENEEENLENEGKRN